MSLRIRSTATVAVFLMSGLIAAQDGATRVDRNVVYGVYSGLALLMDVHIPAEPNGKGVVFIQGCGWHSPDKWNAHQLKSGGAIEALAKPLAKSGFTVFTINHRTSPRFRFPAHLQDAQRAVRWVRQHADKYGIDAGNLAAVGGSSGGHLSLLLGLLPENGDRTSADRIARQSSKVACVVALAPPTDLTADDWPTETATVVSSFIGKPRWPQTPKEYYDASPVSHVERHGGTKFLLIHGDSDAIVPYSQSSLLAERLKAAGAAVQLVTQKGVGHGIPQLVGSVNRPDELPHPKAIARWLNQNLDSEE